MHLIARMALSAGIMAAVAACGPRPDTDAAPAAAEPAAPPASGATVIEGARVFDGERDLGQVLLVVENGVIARILPADEAGDLPPDAERIDHSGRHIVPGLVSNHSHVGNTDGTEHGDRFYTRDHVLRNLRQFQAYGVTTVTALGLNGEPFYGVRDDTARDPALGAQLFGSGPGIGAPGGAPPAGGMGLENDPVPRPEDAEQARQAVREQVERGIDLIKLWVDDLGGSAPQMSAEVYRAAIEEAHLHGARVAAHIHDLEPATDLVHSGVDVIAHGVRDRAVDEDLVSAMAGAGTWYVPTVNINEANYYYAENPERLDDPFLRNALQPAVHAQFSDEDWRREHLAQDSVAEDRAAVDTNLRNLATLRDAGVRIGFGTDSGAMPQRVIGYAEHRELELMTRAGFTPQQAIATATRDAADLLGLDDRGLLAEGRRADFVVLEADPLEDIRNTRGILEVWQAGRRVSGPVADYRAE